MLKFCSPDSDKGVRSLVQTGEDCIHCLAGVEGRGVYRQTSQTPVQRAAVFEAKLSSGGIREYRTRDCLQHTAIEENLEWGVEEDGCGGGCLFNDKPIRKALGCS